MKRFPAALLAFLLIPVFYRAEAAPIYPSLSTSAYGFAETFIGTADTAIAHQYNTDYETNGASTSAAIDQTYTQDVADPGAPGGMTPFNWEVRASGAGTASAGYGSLHAAAYAAFELTPGSVTFEGYDVNGDPYGATTVTPFKPESGAGAGASAVDAFTLLPSASDSGSSARVRFTMTLEASVVGCRSPGAYGGSDASSSLTLYGPPSLDVGNTILDAGIDCSSAPYQTVTATETLGFGNTYVLEDALSVLSQAPTSDCTAPTCDGQSLYADAGDTQLLYIDVLTPGVMLDTESGHDYSTPTLTNTVPEPPSLALFGSALMVAALRRRIFQRPRRRTAAGTSIHSTEATCPGGQS